MPKNTMNQMSSMAPNTAYAPMAHTTMITGAIIENGMRRMAAKSGTVVNTTTREARLPRYMLAIKPQTKSFCSTNKSGPGCRPQIIRPPSSTAAVADPGMPSASIGSKAAVPAALFDVSGAMTPSSCPLPNLSPFDENRLAMPYPMKEAAVAPPGVMPIQQPMTELRSSVNQ